MSSTSVRAEILLALKDEFSKPAAKAGEAGKSALKDLNQGAAGAIQSLTGLNVASVGLVAGIGAMAAGLKYAVDQAAEAEKIFAVTEAVVKSTGGAAGLTAEAISDMAGRLSQLNAVDDEVILSAQNVLLTFKKIRGEAFEQASQAALDLSVVMGGDLRGSMLMIGKALEDPIRGITALRRAGVSFTEDQRALIKELVETGRQAEAMNIILTEVNTQVGGAGAAAADTYAGKMALLKINVDNLAQSIGEKLIPTLTEFAGAMNTLITWDAKLTAAYDEQTQTLLTTSESYDAYVAGLMESAVWAGKATKEDTALMQQYLATGATLLVNEKTWQRYALAIGLVTEKEYAQAQAIANSAHETSEAERAQARLDTKLALSTETTSELALGYARMGAAAQQGSADALVGIGAQQAALDKLNNTLLQQAVDAGMDGTLTKAWDDYQKVLAETQPEIDKLTGDIARMTAAHGQSFTVVTEASHSLEEYELAQIKAATAAQKLAEFTGDSREEYLNLKIAADRAAEGVANMGTEMGLTEQFTADYTKRLMEANGNLSELEAKQMAAEEALRRTTAEFLFQQIAVGLDAEAQLALARELGLLSEAEFIAATAANKTAQAYRDGKIDVDNLVGSTALLRDTISALQDKNITITVSTFYKEYYEQAGLRPEHEGDTGAGGEGNYNGGGGGDTGGGDDRDNRWTGGPVMGGQSYIVGEKGPELFTPSTTGTITPNNMLGGTVINISIDARGSDVDEISAKLAGQLRRRLFGGAAYQGA